MAWTLYTLQTQGTLCTTEDKSENSDAIKTTAVRMLILGIAVLIMASRMEIVLLRIPRFFSFTAQDHASLTASDLELLGSSSCMFWSISSKVKALNCESGALEFLTTLRVLRGVLPGFKPGSHKENLVSPSETFQTLQHVQATALGFTGSGLWMKVEVSGSRHDRLRFTVYGCNGRA